MENNRHQIVGCLQYKMSSKYILTIMFTIKLGTHQCINNKMIQLALFNKIQWSLLQVQLNTVVINYNRNQLIDKRIKIELMIVQLVNLL